MISSRIICIYNCYQCYEIYWYVNVYVTHNNQQRASDIIIKQIEQAIPATGLTMPKPVLHGISAVE